MLHTRFKAESPVLKVGSCHGTQLKVTGLSALSRKPNLDKLGACPALLGCSCSCFGLRGTGTPACPERGRRACALAVSLGGRGFSPGVKRSQPMGFRVFCVRRFLAEAPEEGSFFAETPPTPTPSKSTLIN